MDSINNVLHYPQLDTVLMVEKFIQLHDGEFKKRQLWENLPKGMMYQTYSLILDYLLYSRKISIDAEGKVGWIHYPESSGERIKHKELFWR
jgi:phage pi2 protein 07